MNARIAVGILVLGLLLYGPALDNGFRADDFHFLAAAAGAESLGDLLVPKANIAFFRPAAMALFGLEYALFGPRPGLFIAFNILLHALNALLALRLFRRLGLGAAAAGCGAGLFYLGVFHFGKQVNWACTSGGLLAVALLLGALLIDLRCRQGRFYLLAPLAVLAPLCHEVGLLLPALLLARRGYAEGFSRRRLGEAMALLLLGGGFWLFGNLRFAVGTAAGTLQPSAPLAMLWRGLGYLGLMLLPLQDSVTLRAQLPTAQPLLAALDILRPLLGLALAGLLLTLALRREGAARFLAAWALIVLLPFAAVPLPGGWLDLRYLYPVALPACALAGMFIARNWAGRRMLALSLCALLLLAALPLTLLLERSYHRQGEAERGRLEMLLEPR